MVNASTLWFIFGRNAVIIATIYITVVFSVMIPRVILGVNGFTFGLFLAWILKFDPNLLWLIVPHGILEIPCLLACGYVMKLGESFIRNNFSRYVSLFGLHMIAVLFAALVETYVTPYIGVIFHA